MHTKALFVLMLTACSADRAQNANAPNAEHPADADAAGAASANACLMLYECGCNAGCTVIDHPLASLTKGMKVGVLSGPLKGTTVYVASSQTSAGDSVFTVQRADPSASVGVCALPSSPLIGYGCSSDMSGAARACTTCGP